MFEYCNGLGFEKKLVVIFANFFKSLKVLRNEKKGRGKSGINR